MPSWAELEKEFQSIAPQMQGMRLDIQWGAAGEYFRLAGGYNKNSEKRFFALSTLAGRKLNAMLPNMENIEEDLLNEKVPSNLWFKGIWKISGNFEFGAYGEQKTENGESAGFIYTGSIHNIAEACSVFCLELSTYFLEDSEVSVEATSESEIDSENKNWKSKLAEASDMKPGIFGISIDLKKLFSSRKRR